MAIKSYNRIFNTNLPDMAGELVALQMENNTDLNAFVEGNIDNLHDKIIVTEDYNDLIDISNSSVAII